MSSTQLSQGVVPKLLATSVFVILLIAAVKYQVRETLIEWLIGGGVNRRFAAVLVPFLCFGATKVISHVLEAFRRIYHTEKTSRQQTRAIENINGSILRFNCLHFFHCKSQ